MKSFGSGKKVGRLRIWAAISILVMPRGYRTVGCSAN